jgi:hypothetical protein
VNRPQPHDGHFDAAGSKAVPTLNPHLKQFDNRDGTHSMMIGLGPLEGFDESGARGDIDL